MVAPSRAGKSSEGTLSHAPRPRVDATTSTGVTLLSGERTEHLLSIAKSTFMQKGFVATTMDDIASAAGMSKKTLYKMFASKSDLFRAMLLRSLPQYRFGETKAKGSANEQLRLAIKRVLDIALSPDEIALHRLMVGERLLSPDIAGIFADVIFELGAKGVVEALEHVRLKPDLQNVPTKMVGDMLLGIVFANDHFRLMVDDSYRPSRRVLHRRLELGITMFCEPDARDPSEAAPNDTSVPSKPRIS
jgi:AcrR family transcriptional regulator